MFGVSKEKVEAVRKMYPIGSRVEIVKMNDPYTKMPPGTTGTVDFVDDMATVFCLWDNGSSLGAVFGEDEIKKIQNSYMATFPTSKNR